MSGRFKRVDNVAGFVLLCVAGGIGLFSFVHDTPSKPSVAVVTSNTTYTNTASVEAAVNAAEAEISVDPAVLPITAANDAASANETTENISTVCDVSMNGTKVMSGACSGYENPETLVLRSDTDGCAIRLVKHADDPADAYLFAYREGCPINDSMKVSDGSVKLGQFRYGAGCWNGIDSILCPSAKPG